MEHSQSESIRNPNKLTPKEKERRQQYSRPSLSLNLRKHQNNDKITNEIPSKIGLSNTNRGDRDRDRDPNRNHPNWTEQEDSDSEVGDKEDQYGDDDENKMSKPYYLRRRRNRENRDRDRDHGSGSGKNDGQADNSSITTISKSIATTCCHLILKILSRLFAFPFLTPEPICFQRKTKYAGASKRDPDRVIIPGDPDFIVTPKHCRKVEDLVNFDSKATKNLYKTILERRKEILDMKDKYHYTDVNMTLYPGWTENDINRLRNTFQIFDISGDGLVDLTEIATVLQEFGDKSSSKTIQKNFISFTKTDEFGSINFNDFLSVYHRLTMQPVEDPADQSLTDILKKIDSNMAIRCKLDVLGQLQGGLF